MPPLLVIFIALGAAFAGTGRAAQPAAAPPEGYVAWAGETGVTAEAFRAAYRRYLLATGTADRPALRRAVLSDLLAERLLVAETRAAGLAAEPAAALHRERATRKLLIEGYLQHVLFDTLAVREADLETAFERAHTRVVARHLYAPSREAAELLRARLERGETFGALAREAFSDPALAETGGLLPEFGFDEMDPAFEEAAFTLPLGAVSAPVRTAQGFSIIQVEERFTRPLLTEFEFAQMRPRLEAFVRRRKQQQARTDFLRQAHEQLDLVVHLPAFDDLLGQVTGQVLAPEGEARAAWLARPLATFGPPEARQTWTLGAFAEEARLTDPAQRAQVRTRRDLEDFIGGLAVRAALVEAARAAGLDATPDFDETLEAAVDDWLLDTTRSRLLARVMVPEDSLRAAFAREGAAFVVPEKIHLREIVAATNMEAARLKTLAEAGDFAEIARTASIRAETRGAGGDLGAVTRAQLGPLADAVFAAEAGAVLGPFAAPDGRFAILEVGAREPARPMTFAEARPHLEEQLRFHLGQQLLDETYAALRARYPADVDHDLLYSLSLIDEKTH